jgi:hypothetical protein
VATKEAEAAEAAETEAEAAEAEAEADADADDAPLERLRAHRAKLAATTSQAKRRELDAAQAALARTQGKRWMQLEAHDLALKIRALKREVARIDSGAFIADFDARAAPYVERFQRAQRAAAATRAHTRELAREAKRAARAESCDAGRNAGRNAGRDAGRNAEASKPLPQKDKHSSEKKAVVVRVAPLPGAAHDAAATAEALGDALRTELLGEAAPLYIAGGDVCDACGVAMRIVAAHSVWGCPACGKTRKYDLMTAAAVGHGTEHDYSSNAYHQKNRLVETLENTQGTEYADPPEAITRLVAHALVRAGRSAFAAPELQAAVRAEAARGGPFRDAPDAVERLRDVIPDVEARLKADAAASKTRAALRNVAKHAGAWFGVAHPELAALEGKARADAVAKFQDRVRKQYERSPKIAAALGGFLPLQMRPDQEEHLRRLFVACAAEYDAYRKPGHNNWPGGYPFFIRSVLLLLGLDEFAAQYPVATGPKNRKEHEDMRRAIWAKMDWECVPIAQPFPPIAFVDDADGAQARKLAQVLAEVEAAAEAADLAAAESADPCFPLTCTRP